MSDIKWIKLTTDMFDDVKIKTIKKMPEGKSILLIWVQLLCLAGKLNANGYIFLSENIAFDVNSLSSVLDEDQLIIEIALRTFQNFGMITLETDGKMLLTNWWKHQNIHSLDKIREQNKLRKQKEREQKRLTFQDNTSMSRDSHVTSQPCHANVTQQNKNKNKNKKKIKKRILSEVKTSDFPLDSKPYFLSSFLLSEILTHNLNSRLHNLNGIEKESTIQRWARDIELLIRKDLQEPALVEEVIRFCTSDDFWRSNILSGAKLREKWDQLTSQMKKKTGKSENEAPKSFDAAGRELKYFNELG